MGLRHTGGMAAACGTAIALLLSSGGAAAPATGQSDQQPTFRSSVDVVAVNVQVVNGKGDPITSLRPDNFDVTIGGKRRHVVSADFIQTAPAESHATARVPTMGAVATNIWPTNAPGRTFVLAIDVNSFGIEDSRAAITAAREFIDQLQANDTIGLFTFPIGPRVELTLDHARVERALDKLVGARQAMRGQNELSASEVVDINAEVAITGTHDLQPVRSTGPVSLVNTETPVLQRVALRDCDEFTAQNMGCVEQVIQDAETLGLYYETQATEAMSDLSSLLTSLKSVPGRKTIVVLSAGMPTSDRPGGRPDVASVATEIGRNAAEANATIYTIYIDSAFFRGFSAETRRSDKVPADRAREDLIEWRLLDQFSGAAGGTLMRDSLGGGEDAFNRVLRETSAYYLLGVEPTDADRDGRTRELRVKVKSPGVTVRSRTWVALPKKAGA